MDAMISIIISYDEDEKILKRCLFSIVKQKYEKLQIVIIADRAYNNIMPDPVFENSNITFTKGSCFNNLINTIQGEYIFFCDSCDVVGAGMLSNIPKLFKKESGCICSEYYVIKDSNTTERVTNRFSLSGKIFETQELRKILEHMNEKASITDFYLKCAEVFDFGHIGEGCYLYKTFRPTVFRPDKSLTDDEYKKLFLRLSEYDAYIGDIIAFIKSWIESAEYMRITSDQKILYIASVFSNNSEIQIYLFNNYIKKLNQKAVKKKDYARLDTVRLFLDCNLKQGNEFEVRIFMQELGVDRNTILNLLNSRYENYILRYNRCHEEKNSKKAIGEKIPIEGYALSQYVINQYETGGLGMKTILKSINAYVKNKFKSAKG